VLNKKTLLNISVIALLVVGSLLGFSAEPLVAASPPAHITLTWTGNPETTQTITWETDATAAEGQVEYTELEAAKSFPGNAKMAVAKVAELSTNLGSINIHSVTLANLKPGTRYTYRVGYGACWSERHTFVTAAAKVARFKFLVFGDSQSASYDVWGTTLTHAYLANPGAAFLINMGDLVDVGQDEAQWNGWFAAAKGVIDTIPIMPLVGNHETYTPYMDIPEKRFSLPSYFTAQFKLPANGPAELRGQVYSFDYGNVHFSVLDSQVGEEQRFVPAMVELEKAWLEKDLEATDKNWKVVLVHRPLYNNKLSDDNGKIRGVFIPILDKFHADIVFTAHDHVYARTYPLNNGVPVESFAKGTVYVATGRSGTKTYPNTVAKGWNKFFYNPQDEPNYITVEVAGNILTVKAFKQSGVLIDVWSIDKGKPSSHL